MEWYREVQFIAAVPMVALTPRRVRGGRPCGPGARPAGAGPVERGRPASCTLIRPDGDRAVPSRIEGDELVLEVPELDLYALLVLRESRI